MEKFCTKCFSPHHRIAPVSRMSEIGGVAHLGYVPRDEVSGATVAVAGKDQRFTAERIDRAIRTGNLNTANEVIATGIEGGNGSVNDKWNCTVVRRLTQPIDQLDTRTVGRPCIRRAEWPG